MKKIKIFKELNEKSINSFIEKTNGVIVNYNPIVVEYFDGEVMSNPSVSMSGFPVEIEIYRTNSDIDFNKTITFNRFLVFGNKVVFLNDLKEVSSITFYGKTFKLDNNQYIDTLYLCDYKIELFSVYSIKELINSLQSLGMVIENNHIQYNERTKSFLYISNSIQDYTKQSKENYDILSKATSGVGISISDALTKIHNSNMNCSKIR